VAEAVHFPCIRRPDGRFPAVRHRIRPRDKEQDFRRGRQYVYVSQNECCGHRVKTSIKKIIQLGLTADRLRLSANLTPYAPNLYMSTFTP